MNVRIDDAENAHPGLLRRSEIGRDLTHRIDDSGCGFPATSEEIGDSHGICMQELAQDHGGLQTLHTPKFAFCLIGRAS
ncbi:MAG TPA: hypothetical protein VIE66_20335 [Methylocella sp.]